jgi:FMN phosphatase YigB (HAD superfamily)
MMASTMLPVICFDVGGVLAQICHFWDDACKKAGVGTIPAGGPYGLNDFEPMIRYQAGQLPQEVFLEQLADWVGVDSVDNAKKVHAAILLDDYPGALELVQDLNKAGFFTCCYSNTNGLHWPILSGLPLHPAVDALQVRFASHEIGAAKPDPKSFKLVESKFPPHDRVIFFEDTQENIYGAAQAGWEAFKIDNTGDTVAQMRRIIKGLDIVPNLG